MGKYRFTITDNETGETVYDYNAGAIIAGIDTGASVSSICLTDCDINTMAATCFGAKEAISACLEGEDLARMLFKAYNAKHAKKTENPENLTEKE